jgi:hypothetical protein
MKNYLPEGLLQWRLLSNDLGFMTFALEDYQVVLSHSIPVDRIVKIIPQGDEFGRVRRLKKVNGQ